LVEHRSPKPRVGGSIPPGPARIMKERLSRQRNVRMQYKPNKGTRAKDFFKGVWMELSQRVKWPTRRELIQYTIVVIIFIAFWAAYIGLWDFLFAKGVELIVK
jgi:preprotein translocase subunit SecE